MLRYVTVSLFLALAGSVGIALLDPGQVQAAGPDALVTVTPEETDAILANPGMGWETFHRTETISR